MVGGHVDLPELGVGIVYSPGLEDVLEAGHDLLDVIEIEPETLWIKSVSPDYPYRLDPEVVERFTRLRKPKTVHGVGFPVGGTASLDRAHLPPFLQTVEALGTPWVSEHLSFNRVRHSTGEFHTGFLLPPLQSYEGVVIAAANIRQLSSQLPVPFAFETGANYLQPLPGEMSDGAFYRAVAEEADCGILLDLHNLWANEQNGRQPVLETIAELPLDRVWEVHVAGGLEFQDYWLDAHSGVVPGELRQLANLIVPELPNLKAIVFEIIADYIPARELGTEELLEQVRWMKELWDTRGRSTYGAYAVAENFDHRRKPLSQLENLPAFTSWENALGALVSGEPTGDPLEKLLAKDPGVEVYRRLVRTVRAGTIVATLVLTCRLLRLTLGEIRFRDLLETFFTTARPQLFASDEAYCFAEYLQHQWLKIPYLDEVLAFELASQAVMIESVARTVQFTCEPMALLRALGQGHLPASTESGVFDLVIGPRCGPVGRDIEAGSHLE